MQALIFTSRAAILIPYAAYVIWLVPEFIHTFTHQVDAKSMTNDRRSGMGIAISIWVGIFLAYWLAHAAPRADISWHPAVLYALGILLMLMGVAFRWYAVAMLGKYF